MLTWNQQLKWFNLKQLMKKLIPKKKPLNPNPKTTIEMTKCQILNEKIETKTKKKNLKP